MINQRKILVVDDDPTIRQSCRRLFKERGFFVETAASAKAGLDCSQRNRYDCALVDLKMPDMNGMEVVRSIRGKRTDMPVIIITGHGTAESVAESERLGVSDYICKPFTPEQLLTAVEHSLCNPTFCSATKTHKRSKNEPPVDVFSSAEKETQFFQESMPVPIPWKWRLQNWKNLYRRRNKVLNRKMSNSFSSITLMYNFLLVLGAALMIMLGIIVLFMLIYFPPNHVVNMN